MSLQLVQGDNGIDVTGTVYDNGVGRNLTGATILLKFKVADEVTHDITCTADADQVANPGKFTATLTSTHLATAGKLSYEVQVTDGADIITYESQSVTVGKVRSQL